jgi:AcrR family transcriptional regulator
MTKRSAPDPTIVPAVQRQPAEGLGPRAQSTILRIVEATRNVFLIRGYSGTTIDEIARLASVSRASIYTYFPSKRELLLAVGEQSAKDTAGSIARLADIGATRVGLRQWVDEYFDLLDYYGSFIFAWTQAANEDDEIYTAGRKRHLRLTKMFGRALCGTADYQCDDQTLFGLVTMSMLERSWAYGQLYEEGIDMDVLKSELTEALWNSVHPVVESSTKPLAARIAKRAK